MKKIFLILILVVSIYAQEKKEGAFGIVFGSHITEATKQIVSKGGTQALREKNILSFSGLMFAGNSVSLIIVVNQSEQVIKMIIITEDLYETSALRYFDSVVDGLSNKYGNPPIDIEEYYSPYKQGDGFLYQALSLEKAFKYKFWNDRPVGMLVELQASDYNLFTVRISYEDTKAMEEFVSKKRAEQSKDF